MIIDELIALLGFETKGDENLKRFRDGIEGAQKRLEEFGKRVAEIGRKVALGITAMATTASAAIMGAFKFTTSQARDLAALGDVADRLGVGVERLQEFRHAATMTGMDASSFDNAFRRLIRRSAEAAKGTGAAKNAFKELGVALKDNEGRLKTGEDLMLDVADALVKVKDHGDAMRVGFQMFDTDAAKLMPMMLRGREGIMELFEDARSRGFIFDQQDIDKARAYTDQMALFEKTLSTLRKTVALELMPVLTDFLGRMSNWFLNNRSIGTSIGNVMKIAVESAARFLRGLAEVGDRIGDLFRYLSGDGINLSTWQSLAGLGALLLRIFAPFTFWLTAAYLALDELFAYMEGADSYLGDFIQWIQDTTGASEGLAQILAAVAGALGLLMIWRPLWLLKWLGRLIGLAGGAKIITGLAGAVRGLALALSSLAGASTVASSSGLLGLLGRLGLVAGTGGALLSLSGSTADNDYLNADPEERARMRDEARRRAEDINREQQGLPGKGGRVPRTQRIRRDAEFNASDLGFGPDPERFGGDAPSPANAEALLKALHNFKAWGDYTNSGAAQAVIEDHSVANDNRDQSVNVGSPNVTVHVQQAVEAPAAAGAAVGNAVGAAAGGQLGRRVTGN